MGRFEADGGGDLTVLVRVGGEVVMVEQVGEEDLGLELGEVLANTAPGPARERKKGEGSWPGGGGVRRWGTIYRLKEQ